MTWTYGGDPSANDRDNIRFLVGDTDTNDQQVTDEEIAAVLTEQATALYAAARVSEAIAAKYARKVDTSNTGGLRVGLSKLYDHYMALAKELRSRAGREAALGATISVGGSSVDANEDLDTDTDLTQPSFKVGMDDYSGQLIEDRDDS